MVSGTSISVKQAVSLSEILSEEDLPFWKLIYGLKWQMKEYDHSISAPILHTLTTAFEKLNYPDPAAEAEMVLVLIDGLAVTVLIRKPKNLSAIAKVILDKYGL